MHKSEKAENFVSPFILDVEGVVFFSWSCDMMI